MPHSLTGNENMVHPTILALVIVAAGGHFDAHADELEFKCEEIKQKIAYIRSKMRSGYTRAQGEKMEAELRRLRALRKKACH